MTKQEWKDFWVNDVYKYLRHEAFKDGIIDGFKGIAFIALVIGYIGWIKVSSRSFKIGQLVVNEQGNACIVLTPTEVDDNHLRGMCTIYNQMTMQTEHVVSNTLRKT